VSQFLRPIADADPSNSRWRKTGGAGFYDCIDEANPSDSDYIWSLNGQNQTITFKLSGVRDPQAGAYSVNIRAQNVNNGVAANTPAGTFNAQVFQGYPGSGGTLIDQNTWSVADGGINGWVSKSLAVDLSGISDWESVYVRIFYNPPSSLDRGIGVSFLEVQVPDAVAVEGSFSTVASADTFAAVGEVKDGISGSLAATVPADILTATGTLNDIAFGSMAAIVPADGFEAAGTVTTGPGVRIGAMNAVVRADIFYAFGEAFVMPEGGVKYVCERCGFEYPLSKLRKEWTGIWVCEKDWDPKPRDLKPPRIVPEGVPRISSRMPYPDNSPNTTTREDL